jgi:predicted dienelactone hydrolase
MDKKPEMTRALILMLVVAALFGLPQLPVSVGQPAPKVASGDQATQGFSYIQIEGRQVAMWKPAGTAPAEGYPLIVFSHGFSLCETDSEFMTGAWAQAGYFVLAPHHKDGSCAGSKVGKLLGKLKFPQKTFGNPDAWSDATYRERRDDMEAVLNAALKEKSFEGVLVDGSRVGLAGHSLGGYTALGLAGAWPSWKDPRIKAVLTLSPFCAPFFKNGDMGHLGMPVMFQGGTGDTQVTPTVARPGGGYDLTSPPKCFVEFSKAGHFAWASANPLHDLMEQYALAFLERYLKGVTSPDPLAALFKPPPPSSVTRADYAEK